MLSIDDVLIPGNCISYVSYLGDKAFSRHWAIYEGISLAHDKPGGPLYRMVFLSETDTSLIGLGGPVTMIRAELTCESNLFPRHYRVTTKEAVNEVVIDDQIRIKLPDATEHQVNYSSLRCILGENFGQLALFLKLAEDEISENFTSQFFAFGAASVLEYRLSSLNKQALEEGARWFVSSFDEELMIGRDGWLQEHFVPKEGIVTRREEAPLPDWMEATILEPPLKYAPAENARFDLKDVLVTGPVVLVGTSLTIPRSQAPYPVAVFIGGSGSHDRHGIAGNVDLGSHEIVDFLSENGWLCARFDTRGAGSTRLGEDFFQMGFEETVSDARAVLNYVRSLPKAESSCVALIGHSQGGVTAIELALSESGIHGIVLLASSARRIDEVLRDQVVVRGKWMNQTREQVNAQLRDLDEFVRLVEEVEDWTPEKIPPRFYGAKRFRQWYADHLRRTPLDLIAKVRCPVLICQGAEDFQVSPDKDARALFDAAAAAGVRVELEVFEGLDHLFKPSDGASHISHYYDNSRRVSAALKLRVLRFLESIRSQRLNRV